MVEAALSPRQARITREVSRLDGVARRLEEAARSVRRTMEWLQSLGCTIGIKSMCIVEEAVVYNDVSEGHTVRVSFQVEASWYNNLVRQTDSTPCEGKYGNICDSYRRGENPIAVSPDVVGYPLSKGSRVRLTTSSPRVECKAETRKTFTVMDVMSGCLKKDKDLRTGRCRKPVVNSIDILILCTGEERTDDYCVIEEARANANGRCEFVLTKL